MFQAVQDKLCNISWEINEVQIWFNGENWTESNCDLFTKDAKIDKYKICFFLFLFIITLYFELSFYNNPRFKKYLNLDIFVVGIILKRTDTITYLETNLDENLTWKTQVHSLVTKTNNYD